MSWLHSFKRLYSLDTLDTRCTIPSTTPPRQAATELQINSSDSSSLRGSDTANEASRKTASDDVKPSQWKTPEFYFYYLVFIIAVPLMFKVSFDVSKSTSALSSHFLLLANMCASDTSKLPKILTFAF
jgi:hypothetical protein